MKKVSLSVIITVSTMPLAIKNVSGMSRLVTIAVRDTNKIKRFDFSFKNLLLSFLTNKKVLMSLWTFKILKYNVAPYTSPASLRPWYRNFTLCFIKLFHKIGGADFESRTKNQAKNELCLKDYAIFDHF